MCKNFDCTLLEVVVEKLFSFVDEFFPARMLQRTLSRQICGNRCGGLDRFFSTRWAASTMCLFRCMWTRRCFQILRRVQPRWRHIYRNMFSLYMSEFFHDPSQGLGKASEKTYMQNGEAHSLNQTFRQNFQSRCCVYLGRVIGQRARVNTSVNWESFRRKWEQCGKTRSASFGESVRPPDGLRAHCILFSIFSFFVFVSVICLSCLF